jgi:hypothetical protein
MAVALVAAWALFWTGATLLLDAWWRRWDRPDLAEPLRTCSHRSVADEAQRWLESQ